MKKGLVLFLSTVLTIPVWANEKINTAMKEYAWEKRQLIVFSPSVNDDQYKLFFKSTKRVNIRI